MKVPLDWLSDYIKLPPEAELTDRLTMIGHLLDKKLQVNGRTVLDLELRGNRADLFGLVGIAREISAAFKLPLNPLPKTMLPPKDPKSPLITVADSAKDLVTRYTGVRLSVKNGPSPDWMVKRLEAMGAPSINIVIDITNYAMFEIGEPIHAFDFNKLKGGKLNLRRAKPGEIFQTIQQATPVKLTPDDLVICDSSGAPQSLTMIGGYHSGVSAGTNEILVEAAVYNSAKSRRSNRRLNIMTEAGSRNEKHLDPEGVSWALERAVYLYQKYAGAKIVSKTSDYYPKPASVKKIIFNLSDTKRLGGVEIPYSQTVEILSDLKFSTTSVKKESLQVTVPSFRTDVEGPADIVEEILRIYGFQNLPTIPISDQTPEPRTYPSYAISERLRDILTSLGLSEVVTLTMVTKQKAPNGVSLINPPDPDLGTLRDKICPSLVGYAKRLLNLNQERVAIFEIGKTFTFSSKQKKGTYSETLKLGIAVAGKTEKKNWINNPRDFQVYDLLGFVDRLKTLLGTQNLLEEIGESGKIFWAEIDVDLLIRSQTKFTNLYSTASQYPPIVEDLNVTLSPNQTYGQLLEEVRKISPLVSDINLIDKYEERLTLRITYHSNKKQLSASDIEPVRKKLEKFS